MPDPRMKDKTCGCGKSMPWWARRCFDCKSDTYACNQARRAAAPITEAVRREVLARDGTRCRHCGRTCRRYARHERTGRDRMEFDHLVPIASGGDSRAANVVVSCLGCNRGRQGLARRAS